MHEKPKLQCTRDYSLFEMHEHNRTLHEDPRLFDSMKRVGFMPSSPIQCERNGSGKLKVIRGHHRLDIAKRLSLPVWYVVDNSNTDLFDLEAGRQAWTIDDFAKARAASGNKDIAAVIEFQRKHGLPFGAAASLVGGESAGSTNKLSAIKRGTFKATADMSHANAVAEIVTRCQELGISWARSSAFIAAVSSALRVPEFSSATFLRRASLHPGFMLRKPTKDGCLEQIEALYNYGAKEKRLPLVFRAKEVGRARQQTFGK